MVLYSTIWPDFHNFSMTITIISDRWEVGVYKNIIVDILDYGFV